MPIATPVRPLPGASVPRRIPPLEMFLTFTQIAWSGFGGTMFWARRILTEQRGWLTEKEFLEILSVGQLLPGANILNVTVMIGYRFGGTAGSASALAGLFIWPFMTVIGLGLLHERYGNLPVIHRALSGVSAVVAGFVIANGIKFAMVLPRHIRNGLVLCAAFLCVGVLRWSLVAVVAVLAPVAVAMAWRREP